ncbi:MAG: DUF2066 domain-containing protein [Azospirillum sp.]|nr:DUF2066 domain-containing protein [Azospirillum sp.]
MRHRRRTPLRWATLCWATLCRIPRCRAIRCGIAAAVVVTMVGLLLDAGTVRAQEAYSVSGVSVDVTAANANEARDLAIQQAQRKAFAQLFQQLTGGPAAASPSDAELARLVQSFEIDDERVSAVRYVASLTVHFRADKVRSYVAGAGGQVVAAAPVTDLSVVPPAPISGAAAPGAATLAPPAHPPVVVLPVSGSDGHPVLWEERTPWRVAWEDRAAASVANGITVPFGELSDVADIGVAEALAGDLDAIARTAQRHNVEQVVVAALGTEAAASGGSGLAIKVSRYDRAGPLSTTTVTVSATPGEAEPELLARAVGAVLASLDAAWQADAALRAQPVSRLVAGLSISGLQDWLEARRRLGAVPGLDGFDLLSLSRRRGEVALRFHGDPERLRAQLALRRLDLERPAGSTGAGAAPSAQAPAGGFPATGWELRLGEAAPAATVGSPQFSGAAPASGGASAIQTAPLPPPPSH